MRAFIPAEWLLIVVLVLVLSLTAFVRLHTAQTAEKVAQARRDLRAYAVALESYNIDHDSYVLGHPWGIPIRESDESPPWPNSVPILERLSTPVAYLSRGDLPAAFVSEVRFAGASAADAASSPGISQPPLYPELLSYYYEAGTDTYRDTYEGDTFAGLPPAPATKWVMHGAGPNLGSYNLGGIMGNASGEGSVGSRFGDCLLLVYDPTNGSESAGAIWRAGGNFDAPYAKQMMRAADTDLKAPNPASFILR